LVSALARKYGWGEQVTRLQLFNAAQSQESQEWFASLVETISENAKQLVHRLSVVRTGLTDDLINSLWRQSEEARLLTRELIESCILQPSEDSNTYLLHEFIREYLYEQTPKDLRQKIHRDAGKYFLKNSQEATDKNIQAELLAEALFHFKQAQDSKTIQEFATQCHELLIKRGDRDRAQTVATYALEAAHVLKDDEDSANWLVRIAEREIEHDQLKEGGRHLDKAINVLKNMPVKLSPQQDERKKNLLSHAYLLKGRLAYLVSNFSAAEEIFKEALECARCASNKHEDVYCLIMMGHLARQKKDYDEAYQLFQQASDLATRIKDPELENECFSHLGLISRRRGDFEDAKMRFTQVYENAKKQGNRRVEQTNLNLLGDLYLRLGEYSKAEPLFRQGLNLARKYAIGQGIRICLGQLAEVLVYKGEYAEAQQYLEEDERLSEQVDDGIALAWTISRKGLLIKAQGEKERGNQLILSAIQKLREKGNEDYITDFERFLNLYQ
jgi:tetratricopeptide (TPR) repeat protein